MSTVLDIPRCAWCDETSAGWAKVEPGYGPPHPSCGEHGAEFTSNETNTELVAELVKLRSILATIGRIVEEVDTETSEPLQDWLAEQVWQQIPAEIRYDLTPVEYFD